MSREENARVLEAYTRVWLAGDAPAIFACYHPDFILHYGGDNPLSGTHVGKAAALAVLAEVSRKTRRRLLEVVEILPGERRSAVVVREGFRRGEALVELERVLVYTIKDGLLFECWVFDGEQGIVDEFLR